VIGWVIFHDHRINDSSQDIIDQNIIVCQLVVAMIRDLHFPAREPTHRSAEGFGSLNLKARRKITLRSFIVYVVAQLFQLVPASY